MEKVKQYKDICVKIGFVMMFFFVCRLCGTLILGYIGEKYRTELTVTVAYMLNMAVSMVMLYFIPISVAAVVLKPPPMKELYRKPPRLAKALGNYPAIYGLGMTTRLLSLLVVWIVSQIMAAIQNALESGGLDETNIERSFGTMGSLIPPNLLCGILAFIQIVFAAALFEEFFCRGILLNALTPYGKGFAIIVSGFLFGAIHGNFDQFFFAFTLGIALAYITVQTKSILTSTILHASFNCVSAIIMLFFSTSSIQKVVFLREKPTSDDDMTLALFGIYWVFVFGLLIAGIGLAFKKIVRLKVYKNISTENDGENEFTDISVKRKTLIFFTTAPALIMLVLAADSFAGSVIANKILEFVFYG